MNYIDLHCDTASLLFYKNSSLKKNNFSIDIEKLKKGSALGQVFAFFIDIGETDEPYIEFKMMYKNFLNELNKNSKEISLVKNINDLNNSKMHNKIGAFLSIEEGEVLQGKVERIEEVYNLGIRFITLTWNYKNSLGYPNYNFMYKDNGLTSLGFEFIEEMERVGIIPDCSHLSDKGFWDLIEGTKKPFIATHSNARAIKNHPRNLTDDMIKALSNKGGVMGLNFCNDFVGMAEITQIDDIITHIKHIRNVGGIEVLSLGSDFDGIENEVEIKDASQMGLLLERLEKENFSIDDIEKIFYKNSLRVLEVLK